MARSVLKWMSLGLCVALLAGLCACKKAESDAIPQPSFSGPEYDPDAVDSVSTAPPASDPVSVPEPEVPSSSSEPEPEPQPAPVFVEGGFSVGAVKGKKVTVVFKTDVESTINTIIATKNVGVTTAQFYDYFNRGAKLDGAVSKLTVYNVTKDSTGVIYELPDTKKTYYLLVNAVENLTGTWQNSVSVLKLYDAGTGGASDASADSTAAPTFSEAITRGADSGDNMVLTVKTSAPAAVYAILVEAGAPAPTAKQVKAGANYGDTKVKATGSGATSGDKAPYKGTVSINKAGLAAGSYVAWFVLQSSASGDAPLGEPGRMEIKL